MRYNTIHIQIRYDTLQYHTTPRHTTPYHTHTYSPPYFVAQGAKGAVLFSEGPEVILAPCWSLNKPHRQMILFRGNK